MARKNSSAHRKNRVNDRREYGTARVQRVALADLVIHDGQCSFQRGPRRPKARFASKGAASKALSQALTRGSGEKRYYACPEGGCGGYHLTSREEYNQEDKNI